MTYLVTFKPSGTTVTVPKGATIMDAERMAELNFEYPCGGNGTCGKCMVDISYAENGVSKTSKVKACTYKIETDITVTLKAETDYKDKVLVSAENTLSELVCDTPYIFTRKVSADEAKVGDVRSDFQRFSDACRAAFGMENITYNSVSVLNKLSKLFADDIFDVNAVFCEDTLLDVRTDEFTPLGLAYDIGTTTIACYLIDLGSGKDIDSVGALNEQVKYGGDVISRCIFALENEVDEISSCVREETDRLAGEILALNNCKPDDVYAVTLVGNTCMHHIFAGLNPVSLINVPYTPSVSGVFVHDAIEYISNVNRNAKLTLLPVIAGFIGADTVSVLLSSDFTEKKKPTLMLDIGTNGEMALGTGDRWVTCSTASGPAFEGAKIVKGMRGAPGAVDHVFMENGELKYTTIDGEKAVGICGSGLVDIIKVMLDEEVIIPSGRFNRKYEGTLRDRMQTIDDAKCFVITDDVYVTQKDIREVQLAKGAIAAGIEIMCDALSISYSDINEVLIAGAFGNYMKPESMCRIKMIPSELLSKIVPIGNAAGSGAVLSLKDRTMLEKAKYIAEKSEFIELATHPDFQEKFIAQLDF